MTCARRRPGQSTFTRTLSAMCANHPPWASMRTIHRCHRCPATSRRRSTSPSEQISSSGRYTRDRNMRNAGSATKNPAGTAHPAHCTDRLTEARNERRSPSRTRTGHSCHAPGAEGGRDTQIAARSHGRLHADQQSTHVYERPSVPTSSQCIRPRPSARPDHRAPRRLRRYATT